VTYIQGKLQGFDHHSTIHVDSMHAYGTPLHPLPVKALQHARCVKRERQTAISAKASSDGNCHPKCDATHYVKMDIVDSHAPASSATDQAHLPTISRRDLLRGAITGTIVNSAPVVLHESLHAPPAEAIPTTYKLPPIGQAAPGTYNLGVAAVRDPALYRSDAFIVS
jgi:hypothetical protein